MLLGGNTFEFFMIDPTTFHMQKKIKYNYNNEHFWHFYPTFYVVQGSEVLIIMFLLYLMEAEEVLNGGGRVEDVAFSCHHQHEAAQRLEIENKLSSFVLSECLK